MNQNLLQLINEIRDNKSDLQKVVEEEIKEVIIRRVFSTLGWNNFGMGRNREVIPEYSIETRRVDFALIPPQNLKNIVFIEAKKPDERLDKDSHQEQLLEYAFRQGVKLAVLTNGFTWQFYLPLNSGAWINRRFYTVDFLEQDENDIIRILIELLSKENVSTGASFEFAQRMHDKNQADKIVKENLPDAWEKLLTEPDGLLVELVNDTLEKICGYKADNESVINFLKEKITNLPTHIDTPSPPLPSKNQTVRLQNLNSLDNLTHTKILEGKVCDKMGSEWNPLVDVMLLKVYKQKSISFATLKMKLPMLNMQVGSHTESGFRPVKDTNFSVQYENSQNSAEALIVLARDILECPIKILFEWRNKAKNYPGQRGLIEYYPPKR